LRSSTRRRMAGSRNLAAGRRPAGASLGLRWRGSRRPRDLVRPSLAARSDPPGPGIDEAPMRSPGRPLARRASPQVRAPQTPRFWRGNPSHQVPGGPQVRAEKPSRRSGKSISSRWDERTIVSFWDSFLENEIFSFSSGFRKQKDNVWVVFSSREAHLPRRGRP